MSHPINIIGQKTNLSFAFFLFVLFIIAVSDAVMSYTTPVFLDAKISNTFLVGIVFSASSAVGFLFDIFAGSYLKPKKYSYFLICTTIVSILFPLILIYAPNKIFYYLLAMAIWGIYYEARSFTIFNYIKKSVPKQTYPLAWGVIQNMSSMAYLIGPIIASFLLVNGLLTPLYFSLCLFIIGSLLSYYFIKTTSKNRKETESNVQPEDFRVELKIWKILSGKIWMIWVMWFLLWSIDAAFWTIGILLAEKFKLISNLGSYLIPIYMIPRTFMGFTVPKLAQGAGKKYLTFVSSIIGGVALIFMGFGKDIYTVLVFTFLASASFSVAITAMSATFEDYIERLGKFGPELIGLEQTASSLGYVISPILSFGIAGILSDQLAFVVLGSIVTLWAGLSLIFVPRKIKMPEKMLKTI